MIREANTNTHDSTEYFHIYAGEWESIDAPAEESAVEQPASLEERCPEPEMHVGVPPRVGYGDAIGLYPLFSPDTTFHHIRQFYYLFLLMRLLFCRAARSI